MSEKNVKNIEELDNKEKTLGEVLETLRDSYAKAMDSYEKTANEWWDSLPYEEKCKAFYSIIKRMHRAEVEERGTYRYALYDVFDFGMDMYGIGMSSGYLNLHNLIHEGLESKEDKKSADKNLTSE
jgi:hypothetical protein